MIFHHQSLTLLIQKDLHFLLQPITWVQCRLWCAWWQWWGRSLKIWKCLRFISDFVLYSKKGNHCIVIEEVKKRFLHATRRSKLSQKVSCLIKLVFFLRFNRNKKILLKAGKKEMHVFVIRSSLINQHLTYWIWKRTTTFTTPSRPSIRIFMGN